VTLAGRHALVTGASGGIGAAVAEAIGRDGAAGVTLAGRCQARLEPVAERVRATGARAATLVADLTDPAAIASALGHAGAFDVVVHAAGANVPEPFLDVSAATADRLWALNVRAGLLVSQHASRTLIEQRRGGTIVFLSSQMGHVGAKDRTVYCATKHAVEGLTKAMAVELAPHGIRVVAVAPTFIRTPMTEPFLRDERFAEAVRRQMPLGRIGEPADVAEAVVFLASDRASLTTGCSLLVDGGWTAH